MSDRWYAYFETQVGSKREWLEQAVSHWTFMQDFYGRVRRLAPRGARLLDVGCGVGLTDLYLASCGYQVTGIDSDERIITAAREYSKTFDMPASFKVGDAADLSAEYDRHDLVFSVGVLEHFDRAVTVQLLAEQSRCAPIVVLCIPTCLTVFSASITDERIYSMSELKQIVRDAGLRVMSSFGFGDVTVTGAQIWIRRLLPRICYRALQNGGRYAFNMVAVGERIAR